MKEKQTDILKTHKLKVGPSISKTALADKASISVQILLKNLTSHFSLTRTFNFLNINFVDPFVLNYEQEDGKHKLENGRFVAEEILTNNYEVNVEVPVWTLREDISYKLTPALQLEQGFLLSYSPANSFEDSIFYEYESIGRPTYSTSITTEGGEQIELTRRSEVTRYEVTNLEKTHSEFGHDFYRAEGYLQARYDPLPSVSIALGTRLDYLDLTEQLSVQPRGSVNFKLPSDFNIRFAYGHYEQSPKPYQILSENGNKSLTSSLAQHYIMEIEHDVTDQTELKFATYYKNERNLVTKDEITTTSDTEAATSEGGRLVTEDEVSKYLNQGSAYVGGVEAFLRHRHP